jgi:hypothetical protein
LEGIASVEIIEEMKSALGEVARGKAVPMVDNDRTLTENNAVGMLWKHGFLFPDASDNLCFASNIHLYAWLNSYQRDPMPDLIRTGHPEKLILASISRMSHRRLYDTKLENNDGLTEWRTAVNTNGGRGYVDIVIPVDSENYCFLSY